MLIAQIIKVSCTFDFFLMLLEANLRKIWQTGQVVNISNLPYFN